MKYGLITAEKDPTAYVLGGLGALPKEVLQPDGQWDMYLPVYEPQAENFESCGCTVWGTLNAVEIFLKRLTAKEFNYSERFHYILCGISCPGTDPHVVCENIRANGVIKQESLPVTNTRQEFIQPNPVDPEYLVEGQLWPYTFQHEWVIQGADSNWKEKMKESLQYSPLCVGVNAWTEKDGVYFRLGTDNHWCVIYGYEEGKYWKCFDSYDHSTKKLDWNYGFYLVKRFRITKKTAPKDNWFIELIKKLFKW